MMREDYNGYELSTVWDDGALGFGFRIHDKNGAEVSRSVDPYFYEENALWRQGLRQTRFQHRNKTDT